MGRPRRRWEDNINPLNAELNAICHLLALLGCATIVVVSRLRVKIDLQEVGGGCGNCMEFARDRES